MGGEVRQGYTGVLGNSHHQFGELLCQGLNKATTKNLRLEQQYTTDMVAVITLPETELGRGEEGGEGERDS